MKKTLKNRMILSFSILFFIIITVLEIIISSYNIHIFKEQSYAYCQDIVEDNIVSIDNYFSQVKTITKIVASDKDIVNAVEYRNKTKDIDYKLELYNQWKVSDTMKKLDVLESISNASIIGNDYSVLYSYGDAQKLGFNFGNQKWFLEKIDAMTGIFAFTNFHTSEYLLNDTKEKTISIITPIRNNSDFIAKKKSYLLCDFDISPVLNSDMYLSSTQVAIFDKNNPVYFEGANLLSKEQMDQLHKNINLGITTFVLNKKEKNDIPYIVVNKKSEVTGWSIVGLKSLKQVSEIKNTISIFVIIIGMVSLIAIILSSILISRSILHPLNNLIHKFNLISKGKFDVEFEKSNLEEINTLTTTADKMVKNIIKLNNEILEEHKLLSEAQLKALQHQINPHFLNNTLQSIKALAVLEDTKGISKTITLLGKILYYSIYDPYSKVSLYEEIKYVINYMKIQNIRFNDMFTYSIDIDDDLKDVQVLKLIIQPIVENTIEHGFTRDGKGHIMINVLKDNDDVYIIIKDNGKGIKEEKLNEINRSLRDNISYTSSSSIGLLNVNARIKSVYGENYGIKVTSTTSKTTVVIKILYKK